MGMSCRSSRIVLVALVVTTSFLSVEAAHPQATDTETTRRLSAVGPISSQSLIIVVPTSRDALLGYSVETGQWCRQPVKATENTQFVPVVSRNVAAVRVGNQMFAFSGLTGRWDAITVSSDPPAQPIVDFDTVTLQDGGTFYVFSAKSGRWAGIDLKTGKPID